MLATQRANPAAGWKARHTTLKTTNRKDTMSRKTGVRVFYDDSDAELKFVELIIPKEAEEEKISVCPSCYTIMDASVLKDRTPEDDFGVSGFCQSCRDKIFGAD